MKKRCPIPSFLVVAVMCIIVFLLVVYMVQSSQKDRFVLMDNGKNWRVPIYCINLPSEYTRREHILKMFGSFVEIVDAVDTRNNNWQKYSHYLSDDGLKQMKRSELTKTRRQHYELTPGAIGCFLSHIKCWNKFLDLDPLDKEFVFILEDDTMPAISFDKTFTHIVEDFPPKCDILLCDFLAFGNIEDETYNGLEYRRLHPPSGFYLLNAYFITAGGIKKIFEDLHKRNNKFYKQLDSHLTDLINDGTIQVLTLEKQECFQIGISPTSIQTFTI